MPTTTPTTLLLLLACLMAPVAISQPITTTTTMPTSMDNPTELESTGESSEEDPYRCFKCYEQITESQRMLALYENLQDQERKHLKEKASKASNQQRKPKSAAQRNQSTNASPSLRSARNLDSPTENQPIVVSRLRVARSPPISGLDDFLPLLDSNRNFPKNDVVLKKLKLQQKQQHNKTCKVVQNLKTCLFEISKDCLGNLQFHAMEVFTKQWSEKLDCQSLAGQKVFKNLERSLIDFEEPSKRPIPRLISTRNETTRKLNELFGKPASPRGVVLRPTSSDQQHFQRLQQLRTIPGQNNNNNNGFMDISGVLVPGQLLLLIPCFAIAIMALIALVNISLCQSRDDSKN